MLYMCRYSTAGQGMMASGDQQLTMERIGAVVAVKLNGSFSGVCWSYQDGNTIVT